jgi:uncharacterized protein YkwD
MNAHGVNTGLGFVSRVLAGALLAAALPTLAQPAANEAKPSLHPLVNQARTRGCGGKPGLPGRLSPEPRLDRAAERLGRGQDLKSALSAEGYRSEGASVVGLRGYTGGSLGKGLSERACESLLNPAWRQVGVYQQGQASWVVLAAPFTPPLVQDMAQVRTEVLERVNLARAQARRCGSQSFGPAPALEMNAALHLASELHALDMATHGYISHSGRDGSQAGLRASRAGYNWQRVGENLAAGQTSAEQAVQGWLDSPGHCANLMQPAFTQMGLAFAVNLQSPQGIYWAQVLGTPR